MKRRLRHRTRAQALIEFALASTLLFFLLAAVVDLGLIYFTMQALRVAAQEGATYGSYPKVELDGNTIKQVYIDYPEISFRIYGAAGEQGSGFANLRDLNSNGQDDLNDDRLHNNLTTDPNAYIYVENLKGYDTANLVPLCRGDVPGQELQAGGQGCWIKVTVRYDYHLLFPFAPAFADSVQLQVSHLTPIRSSFYTK